MSDAAGPVAPSTDTESAAALLRSRLVRRVTAAYLGIIMVVLLAVLTVRHERAVDIGTARIRSEVRVCGIPVYRRINGSSPLALAAARLDLATTEHWYIVSSRGIGHQQIDQEASGYFISINRINRLLEYSEGMVPDDTASTIALSFMRLWEQGEPDAEYYNFLERVLPHRDIPVAPAEVALTGDLFPVPMLAIGQHRPPS